MISPQPCQFALNCPNSAIYSCKCSLLPTFLCNICLPLHLSNLIPHQILKLHHSRYVQTSLPSASFILLDYQSIISTLTSDVNSLTESILLLLNTETHISECSSHIHHLQNIYDRILTRFSYLNQKYINYRDYRSSHSSLPLPISFERLLNDSKSSKFYSTFHLNSHKNLSKRLLQLSYIQDSLLYLKKLPYRCIEDCYLLTRYLYHTLHCSRRMCRYDSYLNRFSLYNVCSVVSSDFYRSSVGILPDGNVMIVGGHPNISNTYRLNTRSGKCTQLKSLNHARGAISLFCYGKYLYAFGGFPDSRIAERMEWYGNGWERVADMKEARSYFGTYYKDNKLFMLGGERNSSMEYYDFLSNEFIRIRNVVVPDRDNLVIGIRNKVYLVRDQTTTVLSSDLEVIKEVSTKMGNTMWTLNNVIRFGKKAYYWDENLASIKELSEGMNKVREVNRLSKVGDLYI